MRAGSKQCSQMLRCSYRALQPVRNTSLLARVLQALILMLTALVSQSHIYTTSRQRGLLINICLSIGKVSNQWPSLLIRNTWLLSVSKETTPSLSGTSAPVKQALVLPVPQFRTRQQTRSRWIHFLHRTLTARTINTCNS